MEKKDIMSMTPAERTARAEELRRKLDIRVLKPGEICKVLGLTPPETRHVIAHNIALQRVN